VPGLKTVDELTPDDLDAWAVWQFTNRHEHVDETVVRPVKRTPVTSLTGRGVGTQVLLANGERRWALIANVDPGNPRLTQHFLTIRVFDHGEWFSLARYHDYDADTHGPVALAEFLGLPIAAVFAIRFDLRRYCAGDPAALAGTVEREPQERLTRRQIISLAVPRPASATE
jgi:hypothetical protein